MTTVFPAPKDRFLTLVDILPQLVRDGLLTQADADQLASTPRGRDKLHLRPLEIVAEANLRHPQTGRTLELDALTQWLADHAGQPVFHIDPLKMDPRTIATVMSFAYAQRHRILAVEVNRDEVVIASAEPFFSDWAENLRHVLRTDIRRQLTNP